MISITLTLTLIHSVHLVSIELEIEQHLLRCRQICN